MDAEGAVLVAGARGSPFGETVTSDFLYTLRKTNIAMENGPFEDVFPIENGIFHCYVSLPEGSSHILFHETKIHSPKKKNKKQQQ